jgi:hypothetical protein
VAFDSQTTHPSQTIHDEKQTLKSHRGPPMIPPRNPLKRQPQAQEKPAKKVPFIRQLDKVAAEINPLLVIFMIGLGILDLTCYVGLEMSRDQHAHGAATTSAAYRK